MKNIYENGAYLESNPQWHAEDSPWKAKQIDKMLSRNHIAPGTVCEIGCGAGEILNCLRGTHGGKTVFHGYDISPQAFAICSKKEQSNLHFHLKDLLTEDSTPFDVAMAIDVFEHVEDHLGFLRKFKKTATHKIFHIPLDLSVQTVLRGRPIMNTRLLVGHLHYFTKETALATLEDTGYEILDYFYTNSSLELPGRNWMSRVMYLPRKLMMHIHRDLTVRILGGFSLMVLAK